MAIAECLAEQGIRTLVIDADHQCTASELLLGEDNYYAREGKHRTLHDLLLAMYHDDFSDAQFERFTVRGVSDIGKGLPNLAVIPCSIRIDDFRSSLRKAGRTDASKKKDDANFDRHRNMLRRWLRANFDVTIIDCPPSLAFQIKSLIPLTDGYILPCIPDRLSARGAMYLLDRLRRSGFKLDGIGTLWTIFRKQNAMHCRIVEGVAAGKSEEYGALPRPFATIIPNSTAIVESTEGGQNPSTFKRKYTPEFAGLYHDLCEEILARTQWASSTKGGGKGRTKSGSSTSVSISRPDP